MFETLFIVTLALSFLVGWWAREDKAEREVARAYNRGYADAIYHYGPMDRR